jgi:protein arginine kinase activator
MLCDVCKKNLSSIQISRIDDGVEVQINLCESCAAEKGLRRDKQEGFSINGFLGEALKSDKIQVEAVKCVQCGTTLTQIRHHNKLGCDKCFWIFRKELKYLLQNATGSRRHKGRLPANLKQVKAILMDRAGLQKRLDRALAEENYEKAARLRDKIDRLTDGETT